VDLVALADLGCRRGPHTGSRKLAIVSSNRIIAKTGASLIVTDPIKLTTERPIRELNFSMPTDSVLQGQVEYPEGTPASNKLVNLKRSVSYGRRSWSTDGGKTITDARRQFEIKGVNPDALEFYELRITACRGYQDIRQEIRSIKKRMRIVLKEGKAVTGVLLDEESGLPIADARVYARTTDQRKVVNADKKTNLYGEFHFSKLERREYNLGVKNISPTLLGRLIQDVTVKGGQDEIVTLKVKVNDRSTISEGRAKK